MEKKWNNLSNFFCKQDGCTEAAAHRELPHLPSEVVSWQASDGPQVLHLLSQLT